MQLSRNVNKLNLIHCHSSPAFILFGDVVRYNTSRNLNIDLVPPALFKTSTQTSLNLSTNVLQHNHIL